MTINFATLSGIKDLSQPLTLSASEMITGADETSRAPILEVLRKLCAADDMTKPADMTDVTKAIDQLGNLEGQGFGVDQIEFKKAEPRMDHKSFEYMQGAKDSGNPRAIMNHLLAPFRAQLENIRFSNLLSLATTATQNRIEAFNQKLVQPMLQTIRKNSQASKALRNQLIAAIQTMYDDLQDETRVISSRNLPKVSMKPIK